MRSFQEGRLERYEAPMSLMWLINDIAESKGRQQLFTRQSPEALKALRELAMVQSVESSTRIEGIVVQPGRLQPLVVGDARPRNRSEEEVRNYRDALALVHAGAQGLAITPELCRRLHGMVQAGSGDSGQWKALDNEIIEMREDGLPQVRFRPVSAAETPLAMAELCEAYHKTLAAERVPSLLAAAGLVLDFLCIHPFRDGNGRVSRLLTLLALYQNGYEVGRYVSLERLVEESRDDYYDVLRRSSADWHESRHVLEPWLHFFLAIVRRAYRLAEERTEGLAGAHGTKTARIRAVVAGFQGDFTLAELVEACPGVSRDLVRKVLRDLKEAGGVASRGHGRSARWHRIEGKNRGNDKGSE